MQIASPPPLNISQKGVGKIFQVSPQVEHSIGLPTRHPHVRVCPNNYQVFVTIEIGESRVSQILFKVCTGRPSLFVFRDLIAMWSCVRFHQKYSQACFIFFRQYLLCTQLSGLAFR